MSGSLEEVRLLADQILEVLGVRMRAGQLVIHYSDGLAVKCETNLVFGPASRSLPLRKPVLDTKANGSAG